MPSHGGVHRGRREPFHPSFERHFVTERAPEERLIGELHHQHIVQRQAPPLRLLPFLLGHLHLAGGKALLSHTANFLGDSRPQSVEARRGHCPTDGELANPVAQGHGEVRLDLNVGAVCPETLTEARVGEPAPQHVVAKHEVGVVAATDGDAQVLLGKVHGGRVTRGVNVFVDRWGLVEPPANRPRRRFTLTGI